MPAHGLPWFAFFAFPVFFAGMWLMVLNVLSVLGGWRVLAAFYAAGNQPLGRTFRFRSAQLGWVNYRSCLRFVSGSQGLFIAVQPFFRPGHRALFVPWVDVSAESCRKWVFRYVDLRFAKAPRVRLRILQSLADKIIAESRGGARIQGDSTAPHLL